MKKGSFSGTAFQSRLAVKGFKCGGRRNARRPDSSFEGFRQSPITVEENEQIEASPPSPSFAVVVKKRREWVLQGGRNQREKKKAELKRNPGRSRRKCDLSRGKKSKILAWISRRGNWKRQFPWREMEGKKRPRKSRRSQSFLPKLSRFGSRKSSI